MPKKDEVWEALVAHADERGSVKGDPDDLRRPLALSNHDFTKFLWDWRAQGKLTFREIKTGGQTRAGGIVLSGYGKSEAETRGHKTGLTADVANLLYAIEPDATGWRPYPGNAMRAGMGISVNQLSKAIAGLRSRGRLEQQGGGKGHPITAIRWLHDRPTQPEAEAYLGHLDMAVKEAQRSFPITEGRVANYTVAEELAEENSYLQFRRDPELDELVILLRIAKQPEEEGS